MQTDHFRAMNSNIVLATEGELSQVESGLVAVQNFIEESERRFTRFSEQSELSALNRSAGSWFQASPDLFEVVREARIYFHKTNGLFDPSILPNLKNAGYIHSMDEIPSPPFHLSNLTKPIRPSACPQTYKLILAALQKVGSLSKLRVCSVNMQPVVPSTRAVTCS
jgi:hypothetical protein